MPKPRKPAKPGAKAPVKRRPLRTDRQRRALVVQAEPATLDIPPRPVPVVSWVGAARAIPYGDERDEWLRAHPPKPEPEIDSAWTLGWWIVGVVIVIVGGWAIGHYLGGW